MYLNRRNFIRPVLCLAGSIGLASTISMGCGGFGDAAGLLGAPLIGRNQAGGGGGGGGGGGDPGNPFTGGGGAGLLDPCQESLSRKYVRITMRNSNPDDFIHYFVAFVAFDYDAVANPEGAVCPADAALYTEFGYQRIADGSAVDFGKYRIPGPAYFYYHENGRFRSATGGSAVTASAIPPAQGTSTPTFDTFFGSGGARVPVPNVILFHNPGGAAGGPLRISRNIQESCDQDAFYYVDESDRLAGNTSTGPGSARRIAREIQGTGCECPGVGVFLDAEGAQSLIAPGTPIRNRNCNQFARGGRIEYVFLRQDSDPPVPQLVWRVSDSTGAVIQDFDSRVTVP